MKENAKINGCMQGSGQKWTGVGRDDGRGANESLDRDAWRGLSSDLSWGRGWRLSGLFDKLHHFVSWTEPALCLCAGGSNCTVICSKPGERLSIGYDRKVQLLFTANRQEFESLSVLEWPICWFVPNFALLSQQAIQVTFVFVFQDDEQLFLQLHFTVNRLLDPTWTFSEISGLMFVAKIVFICSCVQGPLWLSPCCRTLGNTCFAQAQTSARLKQASWGCNRNVFKTRHMRFTLTA